MLPLEIPASEFWDPVKESFIVTKKQTINLEHSLVSISKWESKWHKAFLDKGLSSVEEAVDYIRCMTITQNVDPEVYTLIVNSPALFQKVSDYINDPMSATTFNERKSGSGGNREVITSELIYYWMTAFNIPSEYQKWHLNRLLTLIRICGIKNEPPKKMGRNELRAQNRALNAARRSRIGSKG